MSNLHCLWNELLSERFSALHGNNACTRNLGDRLRGCWQRREWIFPFLSLHTQRVLINQNSSKIFDIDCCVVFVMRFIHEPLARMIGASPSHVLTLINWLIDWLLGIEPHSFPAVSQLEFSSHFLEGVRATFAVWWLLQSQLCFYRCPMCEWQNNQNRRVKTSNQLE